jgi:hypothetical protein
MTNMRRALGALAAGAIALPFLATPAAAAPGDTPIPTPRTLTSFCSNVTAPQFNDVPNASDPLAQELALAVRCLRTAGVVEGLPGGNNFAPFDNVNRSSMANFIARMIDAASARETAEDRVRELPAVPASSPFIDVPRDGTTSSNNILRLAAAGIVEGNPGTAAQPGGIGANRYGPALQVTRGQMASFLNRALAYITTGSVNGAGTTSGFAAPTAEYYVDTPQATHNNNAKGITAGGVSNGVGNDNYGFVQNVTRQQMARFVSRLLAALFENQADRQNVPGGPRIGGVLNVFSAPFADESRTTATRVSSGANATAVAGTPATPANSRTYTATGLASGVEYRITLVTAGQVTFATGSNDVRFATGMAADGGNGFLVNTGNPQAIFKSVNGATPLNNSAAGQTPTAATQSATVVFTPGANGTVTFTIAGAQGADVIPVIYLNGGGTQTSYTTGGGADRRLEVDANGRPIEFFGLAGRTTFQP